MVDDEEEENKDDMDMLGIKTIFLELVRCKNEEEQVKEKFTRHKNLRGLPLKATSTELQRSFTIK